MELKDVVLSVLSDIQEEEENRLIDQKREENAKVRESRDEEAAKPETVKAEAPKTVVKVVSKPAPAPAPAKPVAARPRISEEEQFLRNMKERILVMFEGFNSPKNQSVEAKVDLTINFLEYLLSVTDERLDALNAAKK